MKLIRKHWFILALVLIFAATMADAGGVLVHLGKWLKTHHGPSIVIFLIFMFSGITLRSDQIRDGLSDVRGLLVALLLIFVFAPLLAAVFSRFPLGTGVIIGLFLVAVMPTTFSSGVVMTGAAGGNMAHALLITLCSNILAVFLIPILLDLLLKIIGSGADVHIDKPALMMRIGLLVLLPLFLGMVLKRLFTQFLDQLQKVFSISNQVMILLMVWMALAQSRETIAGSGASALLIIVLVAAYHAIMLAAAWGGIKTLRIPPGRRESVLFMGCQKTVTLSVLLQVSLFPQYGIALVVCVLHHIIHLMIDGYLVGRLKPAE